MKDPGSGGHRNSGSASFEAILATFIPTFISAVGLVAIFLALRTKYPNIYTPRTFFDVLPDRSGFALRSNLK